MVGRAFDVPTAGGPGDEDSRTGGNARHRVSYPLTTVLEASAKFDKRALDEIIADGRDGNCQQNVHWKNLQPARRTVIGEKELLPQIQAVRYTSNPAQRTTFKDPRDY